LFILFKKNKQKRTGKIKNGWSRFKEAGTNRNKDKNEAKIGEIYLKFCSSLGSLQKRHGL
jgi:hypothetical protein